ncbi:MAG: ATP-binding cassette domain-containing protein, partial [bacterium]
SMNESFKLMDTHALSKPGAWLRPGALFFCLADPKDSAALRLRLIQGGSLPSAWAWVGWRQREALLRAWRPAAQERYHSVAGRDAPSLRNWVAERFKSWRLSPEGDHRLEMDQDRLERSLSLCGLSGLDNRPMSLLSNGETARACLAAALGARPELLVLDDLSEGLDSDGRRTLMDAAQALVGQGAAVLFLASREGLIPWAASPTLALKPDTASFQDAATGKELFSCRKLDLWAGDKALVLGLDWRLCEGEVWCLAGHNGAGKSSLLAYVSGEHPQAWARSWWLKGRDRFAWAPLDALRREIAWLSPELAAASGRALPALLHEALAKPAALLILDEVLRGLDRDHLGRALAALAAARKRRPDLCVVLVSHDAEELPAWVTKVLELKGGGRWVMGLRKV